MKRKKRTLTSDHQGQEVKTDFKKQHSWNTTDEYEIALRRNRAETEALAVEPSPDPRSPFRNYRVYGTSGVYTVELRNLDQRVNSCNCPDYRKNGLGTCKHIEKVTAGLGRASCRTSPLLEIYLRPVDGIVALQQPAKVPLELKRLLDKFFDRRGTLRSGASLSALLKMADGLPNDLGRQVRVSYAVRELLARQERTRRLEQLRIAYERKLSAESRPSFLKCDLFDYQTEGMLFLAFHGRAILADEMGLGKTVQAVAAAGVMKEVLGISRVLVVCPASQKLEWQ